MNTRTFLRLIALAILLLEPSSCAWAQTPSKSKQKQPTSKTPAGPRTRPKKKVAGGYETADDKILYENYYRFMWKGRRFFIEGRFADALPEFETASRNSLLIPLGSMDDYSGQDGAGEFMLGFDTREFYQRYSLYREGLMLIALGRRREGERKLNESLFLTVKRNGSTPCFSRSEAEHGLAFLAALRGRYSEASRLYQSALYQYRNNAGQLGDGMPEDLNWMTMSLADVELAR